MAKDCVKDPPADLDPKAPPRPPVTDPTLGIPVERRGGDEPAHRLVSLGDSLTHGFQSGAIFRTDLSYPAIIAHELGIGESFRYPAYPGLGGLPLNIEYVLRDLEARYGERLNGGELAAAVFTTFRLLSEVEAYWEHGPGSELPRVKGIHHNLGIYGWDLRDVLSRSRDKVREAIDEHPWPDLKPTVDSAGARAAMRVLCTEGTPSMTPLGAARALGDDGGIETLTILLGANNALKTVIDLEVCWSEDDDFRDLDRKERFTVWRPEHFEAELAELVRQLKEGEHGDGGPIRARHVIFGTVPHVTIAPLARGLPSKPAGERYFPFYARPWIEPEDFDRRRDKHITGEQAALVDAAIDRYNDAIVAEVRRAREEGLDWYVLDVCGLLDRLAARRYFGDPAAQPDWWSKYPLPPEFDVYDVEPDTRFFRSGPGGRTQGGLFSLDGVHPTTITYGMMAQEFINVMRQAGVVFHDVNGAPREGEVRVDFKRLMAADTLNADPPRSLENNLQVIRRLDETHDLVRRMLWLGD